MRAVHSFAYIFSLLPAFSILIMTLAACSPQPETRIVDLDHSDIFAKIGFDDTLTAAIPESATPVKSLPISLLEIFPSSNVNQLVEFTVYFRFYLEDDQLLISPVLCFPGLGENFSIYVNGEPVAREIYIRGGEIQVRRTELSLRVPFRRDLLRNGENVIAIQLLGTTPPYQSSSAVPGLFYDSGYSIQEAEAAYDGFDDFIQLILVSIYLAFGLYHLFLFIRRPAELYGFFFFLFTLGTFGFYFFRSRLAYDLILNTEYLTRGENASIFVLPGALVLFSLTYLRPQKPIPIWAYLAGGFNALCSLLALLLPFSLVSTLVVFWRTCQIPLMLWLPFFAFGAYRRGDRDSGKFIVAFAVLLATAVFDLCNSIYNFNSMEPLFRWGFFGFAITMVAIMGNRFLLSLRTSELLNQSLEKARAELEEAARMRDTFVAAASHEIRTPVHGILGISRILLMEQQPDSTPLSPSLRHSLQLIRQSANRLSRLVDDFVDHSRLKQGQLKINPSAVRLFPVVEFCFASLADQIREKPVQLVNSVSQSLPALEADELRLQQILLNLIGNAVKFTREGSVTVEAETLGNQIQIRVSDTGIGIPREKQEEIFKPFHQADRAIARSYGGTGLGLYIVRSLVDLHRGSLSVESRPGRGSTFSVRLPVYSSVTTASQQSSEPSENGHALKQFKLLQEVTRQSASDFEKTETTPRILVVDDETINSAVLRGILEPAGLQLVSFKNARDAIYYLQSGGQADVAILDWMLGGMSGIDLCLWIRQSYSPVDLPVLILTAHGDNDRMVEGFAAGANDYLEKPVDPVELLARVRTLVDLRFSSMEKSELISYRQELQIARKIHMELLPAEIPQMEQISITARYLPRGDLGGDYYDVQRVNGGVAVFLADVTGHGIGAALGAAMTRVAFMLQREIWTDPAQVLQGVNKIICDAGMTQLVTGISVFVDEETRQLYLARAGHLPGALLHSGGTLEPLFPRGRVMGWLGDLRCELIQRPFPSGDRLILFTDGVTEIRNSAGEFLGEERIMQFLETNFSLSTAELSEAFLDYVHQWQEKPQDDIALIVIESS